MNLKDLLLDYEIESETERRITKERLRKDRYGEKRFPFYRIGRSVFYDLTEVRAVVEASHFGGNHPKRQKAA